jgi:hypothetical protein
MVRTPEETVSQTSEAIARRHLAAAVLLALFGLAMLWWIL